MCRSEVKAEKKQNNAFSATRTYNEKTRTYKDIDMECNREFSLSIVYKHLYIEQHHKWLFLITGMLVCRRTGHILKPATKVILGEREIAFYETLKSSHDPVAMELKKFVPHYYGTTELRVFNNRKDFFDSSQMWYDDFVNKLCNKI